MSGANQNLTWRIHTPNLLKEIAHGSAQPVYRIPLSLLGMLLAEVGERAAELNDPELNRLMCRLTIYSVADPASKDYDPKVVNKLLG